MSRISLIALQDAKGEKQKARESLAISYDFNARLAERAINGRLFEVEKLQTLDRIIKRGEHLTYEQAFSGMCHVLSATNAYFLGFVRGWHDNGTGIRREQSLAAGTAFIQLMAAKEALRVTNVRRDRWNGKCGSLGYGFPFPSTESY